MSNIVRAGASPAGGSPSETPASANGAGEAARGTARLGPRAEAPRKARMQTAPAPLPDVRTERVASGHTDFASAEHMLLGNAATGNEAITELRFKDGATLSFGEVVALSGDFVGSVDELRALVATEAGQAELRWVRWFALSQQDPEPSVPSAAKKRALLRYVTLVADNSSHFSHGGKAIATYERGHAEALRKAHEAGATGNEALFAAAVTDEACCQHYLSDTFSAGHVRAPVIQIRETYRQQLPDSIKQVLKYAINRMIDSLEARGDVPWYWPRSLIESKALGAIDRAAGSVIDAFSLGDLVALACHNVDGGGLNVISAVHPSGVPVPGGYHWRAVGDGMLTPTSTTWRMAVTAMQVSRAELDFARTQGAKAPKEPLSNVYAATRFIPREDASKNPVLAWRWGSMNRYMLNAVNVCLKEVLVGQLRRYPPDPAVMRFDTLGNPDPDGSVELHVGEAFEAFCRELETDGIGVAERAVRKRAGQSPAAA